MDVVQTKTKGHVRYTAYIISTIAIIIENIEIKLNIHC